MALHAGERYRVEFTAADVRFKTDWFSGYSPALELLSPGAAAPLLTVIGDHDGAAYSGLITAPVNGVYTLRPQLTAAYTVRVSVGAGS